LFRSISNSNAHMDKLVLVYICFNSHVSRKFCKLDFTYVRFSRIFGYSYSVEQYIFRFRFGTTSSIICITCGRFDVGFAKNVHDGIYRSQTTTDTKNDVMDDAFHVWIFMFAISIRLIYVLDDK